MRNSAQDSPCTLAQRWVMALPWHAVMRWRAPWRRFGLVARPARSGEAAAALERDFAIVTGADVERTLASLTASAHVRDAAWHLTNAVVVAELAYAAYLLDEARAWLAATDAARALQRMHRGWFGMAEGYLHGLGARDPAQADEARALLTGLFAAADSPWNTLPWATPLPDLMPPPRPPELEDVLHVDDPDTFAEVLESAPEPCRIRLGPGTYYGAFAIGSRVIERAEHAPLGSVVLEALEAEPLLHLAGGGACVRGLTLRGSAEAAAVLLDGGFLRLEECCFEGGLAGVEARPQAAEPALVQLDDVVFEGQADSAVSLVASHCRARNVSIGAIGGCGFMLEGSRLHLEEAFIEAPDRAGVLAAGGEVQLRRVRIHDAQRWGIALSHGARAELHDVDVMRAVVGLRVAEGAQVLAERCRLADAMTANVELLDIGGARFHDCHITGGQWSGAWLHPGTGASFKGGQIGGSRLACLVVEGGYDVTLSGVGLGPSREGGGLFLTASTVTAEGVFVSGAALAGIELRMSRLVARDLRVRGSVEGVLVRDGARLEGYRLDLADVRGSGLWLADGSAAIEGLGLRKVGFGIVVGAGGVALVSHLVCAHTPVVVQVEGGRLALAGRLTLGGGAVRVRGGHFASRDLSGTTVSASDAALYLEGGAAAVDVQGRSRLVLVRSGAPREALVRGAEVELVEDPSPPPVTALSPLLLGLREAPFATWGVTADSSLLLRLARALTARLGLADKLALRETTSGLRADGPLSALAKLAQALELLWLEAGALGVVLADLAPSSSEPPFSGPQGLA